MDIISPSVPENSFHSQDPIYSTVEKVTHWDKSVNSSQLMRDTLKVFEENHQTPGILVFEQQNLIGLISRERIYEKLGRPFGVELFLKENAKQFYEMLGVDTLVLPSDTPIDNAVKMALMRREESLYDPIVIQNSAGYRFISMSSLLVVQQNILQDLYSEIHKLSIIDPLTLVNNRRGFFNAVTRYMLIIRRFDLEYAFMMIDIDKFKDINDRYGHLVGDEVIRSVVRQITHTIREKDVLGRFGGEEFIVFLSDASKETALQIAERVRQSIAGSFHVVNGFQIHATVSIGISYSKGSNHTHDRLLTEADQAAYAAKNMGRNKVVVWDENLVQPRKKYRKNNTNTVIESQKNTIDQMLDGLLHMLYLRDYETKEHTLRVSEMALKLAKKVGGTDEWNESVRIGALLHDIGKIGIPDQILFKPAGLTEAELVIMKKHPEYAHELLAPISYFQHVLDIPFCHHEHWDGKGYPRGLRGEAIPLSARIFTLVDVWDALSSDRPYRPAWTKDAIRDFIMSQSGIQFDPALLPIFLENME